MSLTGACNLSCSYCSNRNRDRALNLDYDALTKYVESLTERGLRAVILTGGGEPLMYPRVNELVRLCRDLGLLVGLITNGFEWRRFDEWDELVWVRISANIVPGWLEEIDVPEVDATVGVSVIYQKHSAEDLRGVQALADKVRASYVRIFPEYSLTEEERTSQYREIDELLAEFDDHRLSVLRSTKRAPRCRHCHLSHFRPYLGEDGGVYQCCVSPLAGAAYKLPERHRICRAEDIAEFLDGRISARVIPALECDHCTYADVVEALDRLVGESSDPHDMFV